MLLELEVVALDVSSSETGSNLCLNQNSNITLWRSATRKRRQLGSVKAKDSKGEL
jgi:hypothetical protein